MSSATALMPRATIHEIVAKRNEALSLFAEGYATLQRAREIATSATPAGYLRSLPAHVLRLLEYGAKDGLTEFQTAMTRIVDAACWEHVITTLGVERLMDSQERKKLRHQLETEPPAVTAETFFATMEQLQGDAHIIFKRGIANAFSKLDRRFRSHDGFKIKSRICFDYAFSQYGSWGSSHICDLVRDVERAFHVLDDKEHPERYAGIVGAIDNERLSIGGLKPRAFEAETEYFRAKVYKKGSLHLWFKRDDLVERVNRLLADYYGEVLGAGADVAKPTFHAKTTPAKNFGFFPTPAPIVDWVVSEAYLQQGTTVLEPSAGTGRLSTPALNAGCKVTAIEIQPHLAEELNGDPRYVNVLNMDFLSLSPDILGCFDTILMNPPFDSGRDVDHVSHAIQFLAPGGKLVAIMSAGVEFRSDAKTVAFRELVEQMGGRFTDLPAGSFSEVGTNVNTCVLSLRRKG